MTTAVVPRVNEPFIKLACRAFRYPFEGGGAVLVLTGTSFLVLLNGLLWVVSHAFLLGFIASIILVVLGGGYLFAFVKSVVLSSAQGDDKLPDWPDFSDISGEVVGPFFQGVVLLAVCLSPGLIAAGYGEAQGDSSMILGGEVLIFLGLCYLPMALLGMTMFDSAAGVNPVLGIPSAVRIAGHYLITLVVFFSILGLSLTLGYVFTELLPIPILPRVLMAFFNFYALMVLARTLGVLYRTNAKTLGWFKKRSR